jgi:hypothetical protein
MVRNGPDRDLYIPAPTWAKAQVPTADDRSLPHDRRPCENPATAVGPVTDRGAPGGLSLAPGRRLVGRSSASWTGVDLGPRRARWRRRRGGHLRAVGTPPTADPPQDDGAVIVEGFAAIRGAVHPSGSSDLRVGAMRSPGACAVSGDGPRQTRPAAGALALLAGPLATRANRDRAHGDEGFRAVLRS